jgi:ribonucleoside-triphosphate reductase
VTKIENLRKMKVTKVDGEVVNFYPYKIALVVETLTSDAALQDQLKRTNF